MLRVVSAVAVLFSSLLLAGPFGCPVSHVDLCEEQLRVTCEFQFRCCDAEERLTGMFASFPYVATEAECVERISGFCRAQSAAADDAAAAGRLRFNGAKAQECLAALREARDSCDQTAFDEAGSSVEGEVGPCAEASEGLVAEGDACASTTECADEDAICEVDYDDPDLNEELGTRDGECVGPGGEGDDCETRDCREGLRCLYDTADSTYTCQALPGLGEPCPAFECVEGLGCGYDSTSGEYRCMEPAALGETCASGVCEEGLVCTYDPVTFEQTCENPPSVGEPCPNYACEPGAYCDDSAASPGTCAAQVPRGGECDPNVFEQCAGEGSWCDDEQSPPVCTGFDEPDDPDRCNGN